jgi:poly(hydroxyalkanoate) depolymerase family esterase
MTHRTTYGLLCRKSIALLAVAFILLAAGVGLRLEPAWAAQGQLAKGTFSNAAGSLSYEVYVPSTYAPGTPVPLVVAMHGCSQTAEQFRNLTGFDKLAEAKNAIVVFPEQSSGANQASCWNFFKPEHMQRGAGEPALIAGITQRVQEQYSIDPKRIYAAGLSAGGAMASVMSATYPDVFAAAGIGSGCEYAAGAECAGHQSADPEGAGREAHKAMGAHARVMPVIVFQGEEDTTVPVINAQQLVEQWQATNDWADNGARDGSIPAAPSDIVKGAVPNGRSYTVAHYSDGHGGEFAQYWLVHGMGHAWSGGCSCETFSDPSGPDATAAMYDFFMSHPAP